MAKAKPAASKEPVATRDTKLTSGATVKSLLKSSRSLKEDLDHLTTTYSAEVREAVDKKFLHKKAFNTIKMLDRMSPEKLADFMEHFDHYFEVSGLEQRAQSAERLPMGDKVGEEGDNDNDDDKKKGGVKEIADKAGASLN